MTFPAQLVLFQVRFVHRRPLQQNMPPGYTITVPASVTLIVSLDGRVDYANLSASAGPRPGAPGSNRRDIGTVKALLENSHYAIRIRGRAWR